MSSSLRPALALALLGFVPAAGAQGHIKFGLALSVSGNNSDNSGFNVGSSQIAGNTFGPTNRNAGNGSSTPIMGAGSFAVEGGRVVVASAPTYAGAGAATPLATATAQLSQGILHGTTASGAAVTIMMSPRIGATLANAIAPQTSATVERVDQARLSVADALEANGCDKATAVYAANALIEVSEAQAAMQHGGPDAAYHAAAAVSLMSRALATFMSESPSTKPPAPLLAAAMIVRSSAAILPASGGPR